MYAHDMDPDHLMYTLQFQRLAIGEIYEGASLSKLDPQYGEANILEWIKQKKHFLVMTGPSGIGKTYFCSALIPRFYGLTRDVKYFNERTLFSKVRAGIARGGSDYLEALKCIIDAEFLIIDDLASTGVNDWRKEILFEIIDQRYSSGKPTVFTSNVAVKSLSGVLGERSASRLLDGKNTIVDLSKVQKYDNSLSQKKENPSGV